jgi:hypothetical protein
MLVKVTVDNLDLFKVACEATDITVKQVKNYGKKTVVQVSVKSPSQLYECGMVQGSLPTDAKLEEQVKALADVATNLESNGKPETKKGK